MLPHSLLELDCLSCPLLGSWPSLAPFPWADPISPRSWAKPYSFVGHTYIPDRLVPVLDPEKGVCADPVGGDATLGVGGLRPPVGVSERQLSLDREGEKT
jgi:hypothetical protein